VVNGVFVNGQGPYRFLVDTATTYNHLDPDLARSIGLKPGFRSQLTSLIGMIEAPGTSGVEVASGPVRAHEQKFLFAGMETVHQLSPDIQGVLGQQFLSAFDYLLDSRARRLEFGPLPPGGHRTQVPFRNLHERPVVSTSLGELAVDSGADSVTCLASACPDRRLWGSYPEGCGLRGGLSGVVKRQPCRARWKATSPACCRSAFSAPSISPIRRVTQVSSDCS
jgi:hypothetical protein